MKRTIEVLYTTYDSKNNPEGFEIACDIRCFADPDAVDAATITSAYEVATVAKIEVDPETQNLREHIYHRMQGGRIDEELSYHGGEMRSMSVGDIVVIDGQAHFAARIGFKELGDFAEILDDDSEEDLRVERRTIRAGEGA
ncbi:hypothetical protein ACFR9U_16180 [Halorientalis brevis]|uniref:Uncharacterized protein n=1 Tax=Halorientalis brevis TaxID=1126241 RepID=A0ABD6CEZ5_9EURY|nr:hypothetical protein [Halorientalis brevis]